MVQWGGVDSTGKRGNESGETHGIIAIWVPILHQKNTVWGRSSFTQWQINLGESRSPQVSICGTEAGSRSKQKQAKQKSNSKRAEAHCHDRLEQISALLTVMLRIWVGIWSQSAFSLWTITATSRLQPWHLVSHIHNLTKKIPPDVFHMSPVKTCVLRGHHRQHKNDISCPLNSTIQLFLRSFSPCSKHIIPNVRVYQRLGIMAARWPPWERWDPVNVCRWHEIPSLV